MDNQETNKPNPITEARGQRIRDFLQTPEYKKELEAEKIKLNLAVELTQVNKEVEVVLNKLKEIKSKYKKNFKSNPLAENGIEMSIIMAKYLTKHIDATKDWLHRDDDWEITEINIDEKTP